VVYHGSTHRIEAEEAVNRLREWEVVVAAMVAASCGLDFEPSS
jgi:hypothetical protein